MKVDNKKIVISLVVGVIALVVLIASATYAYFSANNSASGTTTLEATAEEIGVVTVTNPTSSLYLRLSAVEMAEANQGTNYYATSTNSDGYVYSSTEEYNSIANMKVTGGVTDTKYSCSFKINITKPSTIKSGDMSITFKTDDTIKPTINGVTSGTAIDLYSASAQYTASFTATGEHTSGYDIISTAIRLNNTTSDQIYLAGENLGVTITLSDIDCEVSKVEEEVVLAAGLYDENDNLVASWDELVEAGAVTVSDGSLSGVKSIDSVYGQENLTLVVSDEVTRIPFLGFNSCLSLKKVILPDSITALGSNAFNQCTNLVEVLNVNLNGASSSVFVGNTSLSNITISEHTTSINALTIFGDCPKLISLTIPNSVTTINASAFTTSSIEIIYYSGTATGAPWGATNATVLPYEDAF